ncbi:MAG: AAA family ATPase [Planctomycetaceae bacterium]
MSTTIQNTLETIETELGKVLMGKPEPIRLVLVAMLSEGHVLLEDVPGVGKTSLAKGVAKVFDCDFKRLQFTPDMLPSDILGSSVYLSNTSEFDFRKGPIFTNVLLADEINRTTPRTQSALLEAMEEHQVSAEGQTYPLAKPFFVIATQNPFESEGTNPLPQNQLDRLINSTEIGYPQGTSRRMFSSLIVSEVCWMPNCNLSAPNRFWRCRNRFGKFKSMTLFMIICSTLSRRHEPTSNCESV